METKTLAEIDEYPRWTYTVPEVAEKLGRSRTTIRAWIDRGLLETAPHLGHPLILADSIERFLGKD